MFGKEKSYNIFKGKGDFPKKTHQRPSGRANINVNAFEMLLSFASGPLHYSC